MRKNKVVIKIKEEAEQEEIVEELNKKMVDLKKLYKDEKNPISVEGKVLTVKEKEELKKIINQKIKVDISFKSTQGLGLASIKKVYEKDVADSVTRLFRGSLRSGQKLEFEGSLVIIGDVNSGAEVIASDNIIIVGILRGLAHAGAQGNKKAIIAANSIEGPQIRIANIVKEIEFEDIEIRKQYAYIDDESIILEE
jgi:septum site-determining protein MinC